MKTALALAETLRTQRIALKLTQKAIADKLAMSQQMYAKYEKTGKMSTVNLFLIANVLRLDLRLVSIGSPTNEPPNNDFPEEAMLRQLKDLSDDD